MLTRRFNLPDTQATLTWAARSAALVVTYFVAGKLGLLLPAIGSLITLIWLPAGIAVAVLLRWGLAYWPGVFVASLAVNMTLAASPWLALSIAVGNTLGPVLSTLLLKYTFFNWLLDKSRDILMLIVSAAAGMVVSASGGVLSLYLFNVVTDDDVLLSWFTWSHINLK